MPNTVTIPGSGDNVTASHQNSRVEFEYVPSKSLIQVYVQAINGKTYDGSVYVNDQSVLTSQEESDLKSILDKLVEKMLVNEHGGSIV